MSVERASKKSSDGQRPALREIVLGTRGSELARMQAQMVEAALRRVWPKLAIEVRTIRTSGDESSRGAAIVEEKSSPAGSTRDGSSHQGRKGLFTGEIERALLAGMIDCAVHSAKDLPSEQTADLEICAVLLRGPVEDVFISKNVSGYSGLPQEGTVATGSVRRKHQLRWHRPGLSITDLRGNVPTRLRKLGESDWDGIILARAGLERLGFQPRAFEFEQQKLYAETLPLEIFVPAGGQGVIALQTRTADARTREIVSAVDHRETHLCLSAERDFLRLLGGDCDTPVGVLARLIDGKLEVRAQFFEDAIAPKMACAQGGDPEKIAVEVFHGLGARSRA